MRALLATNQTGNGNETSPPRAKAPTLYQKGQVEETDTTAAEHPRPPRVQGQGHLTRPGTSGFRTATREPAEAPTREGGTKFAVPCCSRRDGLGRHCGGPVPMQSNKHHYRDAVRRLNGCQGRNGRHTHRNFAAQGFCRHWSIPSTTSQTASWMGPLAGRCNPSPINRER